MTCQVEIEQVHWGRAPGPVEDWVIVAGTIDRALSPLLLGFAAGSASVGAAGEIAILPLEFQVGRQQRLNRRLLT